jgi:hypothetical protein
MQAPPEEAPTVRDFGPTSSMLRQAGIMVRVLTRCAKGEIMGREEKRLRERTIRQLERRLGRKPTDEEVEEAIADVRETQRKTGGRSPGREPRRLAER